MSFIAAWKPLQAQQLNHQDISNGLWAMAALDVDLEDQVPRGAQMEVS